MAFDTDPILMNWLFSIWLSKNIGEFAGSPLEALGLARLPGSRPPVAILLKCRREILADFSENAKFSLREFRVVVGLRENISSRISAMDNYK